MARHTVSKLNNVIKELTVFLERDFSSRFKNLSEREDRQLFFLAKILTQLKQVYRETNSQDMMTEDMEIILNEKKKESNLLLFPALKSK